MVFTTTDQFILTPAATQTGLLLNMTPLALADPDLQPDDFHMAIWQSSQWDQGIWLLPVSASVNLMIYEIAAFDRAGLAYPHADWTITDIEYASRALSQNNVYIPSYITLDQLDVLLYSLTNSPFYADDDRATPRLSTPALVNLVQTWANLENEQATVRYGSPDYMAVPLKVTTPFSLLGADQARGFAVSAGTQHPELAYELAKYLTFVPEFSIFYPFDTHARQSMSNDYADFHPKYNRFCNKRWVTPSQLPNYVTGHTSLM